MMTPKTGVGTMSSAHSSVLSTSQKLYSDVGKPICCTYWFITAGFDSRGNHRFTPLSSLILESIASLSLSSYCAMCLHFNPDEDLSIDFSVGNAIWDQHETKM